MQILMFILTVQMQKLQKIVAIDAVRYLDRCVHFKESGLE